MQNAVSHPKQVIQQAKNTVKQKAKQTYQKVASAGSGFVKAVSNGGIRGGFSYVGNGAKKVYSSFKSYAAERTSEIRATIHKEMCTTNNRISSLLGKVDWSAVKKVVAGGVILGGLAAATVLTGVAAAVIAGGALSGALIGGGTGAVLGGISSAASGEGFISGAADGFLWGTIGGAVSGGVGAATGSLASSTASSALKNPLAKSAIENAADTAVGTIDDLAHGRDVTAQDVALDFAKGMISSGLSKNSGTLDSDSNHLTDTEISWPSKPHTNKTEGHWETIVDKTNELAESAFDYTIYISINYKEKYITAVFEKNVLKNEKIESIKNVLASYMESPYTEEIYTMDKEETPLLYAAKINPSSSFKTLRVLSSKTIN